MTGTAPVEPEGVFINCPFDAEYESCHRAILLTVVACGFQPRSALESNTVAAPRMQRISRALRESSYSIHDLTRAAISASGGPRYNMPFEFGMAYVLNENQDLLKQRHDWFALLPEDDPYGTFISDLSGHDVERHDGTPESVVPPVMGWLATRTNVSLPAGINPSNILGLLEETERELGAQQALWRGKFPWAHRIDVVRDIVSSRLF